MKREDFEWSIGRCEDRGDYFRLAVENKDDMTPKQIGICLKKHKTIHGKDYRDFAVKMGSYLNKDQIQFCLNKQHTPFSFREFLSELGNYLTSDQIQYCIDKQKTPSDFKDIVKECYNYLTPGQVQQCMDNQETSEDYKIFMDVNSIYMNYKQLEECRRKATDWES